MQGVRMLLCGIALAFGSPIPAMVDSAQMQTPHTKEVVIQIGGRFCEYFREEVDKALRRRTDVLDVEFLNRRGTVLVRLKESASAPEVLAEEVERASTGGWGCRAWVDRVS